MSPRLPKGSTVPVLIRKVPISIHEKMKILAIREHKTLEAIVLGWMVEAVNQLWEEHEGQTHQSRP